MAMPMGDVAMGDSVFTDALAGAAVSEAALTTSYAAGSAQDDGGSASDDGAGGPGGTVLLVGAIGLAGLGVAVAAGGGGNNDNDGGNGGENQAPAFSSAATASVDENADLATVLYDANATDADGDTLTYALSGDDADLFNIDTATGEVTQKAFIDVDAATDYHFTVTASDGTADTNLDVTLTINPTEVTFTDQNIDGVGPSEPAAAFDASTGAINYTDDAAVNTNVIISSFGADDKITFSNAADGDYKFGTLDGGKDLQIIFNNTDAETTNIIVLDDVLVGTDGAAYDGLVVNEASAETALATLFDVQDSNFFNFA
jgi:hypothetical protein